MTLFACKTDESVARLGIAATRKLGGAVRRNRAKRLVRELFRLRKPAAGLDIIVVPRREFFDASFDSLTREFSALLDRVDKPSGRRSAPPRRGRGDRAGAHSRV
jgi:ribonuclease P protein component